MTNFENAKSTRYIERLADAYFVKVDITQPTGRLLSQIK